MGATTSSYLDQLLITHKDSRESCRAWFASATGRQEGKSLPGADAPNHFLVVLEQAREDAVQLSPPKILFHIGLRLSIFTGAHHVARDRESWW